MPKSPFEGGQVQRVPSETSVKDVTTAGAGGDKTRHGLLRMFETWRFMKLWEKHCVPVNARTPALSRSAARDLRAAIPRWTLLGKRIHREVRFRDFRGALEFVNRVGKLAESEGHHPDILIHSWNRVKLTLRTDAIHALSENDFILAAKIDRLPGTKDRSPS